MPVLKKIAVGLSSETTWGNARMCLENALKMGLIRKTQAIGHICDAFTLPYPLSRKVDTLVQLPGMGRHTRGGPESPDPLIAAHTGQLRQIAQGGAAGWPVLQELPHRLDLFAKTRGDGRSNDKIGRATWREKGSQYV